MNGSSNNIKMLSCFTFLIIILPTVTKSDDSVHILSSLDQLVTSSTLRWLPVHSLLDTKGNEDLVVGGEEFVNNIEGEDGDSTDKEESIRRPIFICRAFHNGIPVTGGLIEGEKRCLVSLSGTVHPHDRYDLLENVENSARLVWVFWNKFHRESEGTVAVDNIVDQTLYVARHNESFKNNENEFDKRVTHVGRLDPKEGLGKIIYVKSSSSSSSSSSKNYVEESVEEGEVLVEYEPISYELKEIKFADGKKRIVKKQPRILGEATLRNGGENAQKVAQVFTNSYNYSSYWGQGHAILKGLNVSITLANGTKYPDIWWGTETNEIRDIIHSVEIRLEPGTAVNVTLRGNYTDVEIPYVAKLLSHYKDGVKLSRVLSGFYREESIVDVKPIYGPIYYMNNMTLVPTTTTTTTTTTSTTTLRPEYDNNSNNNGYDTNNNFVYTKGDKGNDHLGGGNGNNVIDVNVDDGPLSLKNKLDDHSKGQSASRANVINNFPSLITMTIGFLFIIALRDGRSTNFTT